MGNHKSAIKNRQSKIKNPPRWGAWLWAAWLLVYGGPTAWTLLFQPPSPVPPGEGEDPGGAVRLTADARGELRAVEQVIERFPDGVRSRRRLFVWDLFTLSFAGHGLLNVALADLAERPRAVRLLGRIVRCALQPAMAQAATFGRMDDARLLERFRGCGLYLSHLDFLLGCYRLAGGEGRYDALHTKLSRMLADAALAEPTATVPSWPGLRWPADHTVTLGALALYDRTHGTQLATRPYAHWRAWMREHGTDPATGLMISALNPDEKTAAVPRGCALGWSILFLAHLDPQFAAAEYQRFRAAMFVDYGPVGGFREYPAGREGPADVDSGPILFDVGVAATGFGLGAARLMGDEPAFRRMMTMGHLVGFPAWWRGRRWYRAAGPIGNAIMLCGLTAGPWPGDPPWPDLPRPSAPPAGPGTFPLLLAGLWLLLLLHALVRGLDLSPRSGTPRSRVRPVLALALLTGILAAASLWWPFSTLVVSLAALAVMAAVRLLWALGWVLRRWWGTARRNPRP